MIWIGVDAHKRLHEAVALSEGGVVGSRRIANDAAQWAALLEWAQQWPERVWAVEGAWYLGRGLAQYLAERGEEVHEVSGRWTAQRRRGMRRPGKSDRLDAHSVATLLREERATLPRVYAEDDDLASVQLWSRLEAELSEDRTRILNRLHNLLLLCDPGYAVPTQYNLSQYEAPADWDATHRFALAGTYEIPSPRNNKLLKPVLHSQPRSPHSAVLGGPEEQVSL